MILGFSPARALPLCCYASANCTAVCFFLPFLELSCCRSRV